MAKQRPADGATEAGGDDGARRSPEAEGVAKDVRLLGPEEIREVFDRAGERDTMAAERDELRDRVMRVQADLDNFRRREVRERRLAAEEEADRILAPVLDALDTFERALEAAERGRDFQALLEGVRLTIRELERGLAEAGVTRVEGVGQALNPAIHRAIMQEPTADHPPLQVLQVLSHGWMRGDRVIRPAQVKVSAPLPGSPPGAPGAGGPDGGRGE